jgi:hypothetical protein
VRQAHIRPTPSPCQFSISRADALKANMVPCKRKPPAKTLSVEMQVPECLLLTWWDVPGCLSGAIMRLAQKLWTAPAQRQALRPASVGASSERPSCLHMPLALP